MFGSSRLTTPLIAVALGMGLASASAAQLFPRSAAADKARVYFISPAQGQVVTGPVTVRFGLENMGVAPAGTAGTGLGHHHLIIDAPLPSLDQPLPNDDKHMHFGKGQTQVVLTLAPGKHTLQLVLGDANHLPHQPAVVSERITITVK